MCYLRVINKVMTLRSLPYIRSHADLLYQAAALVCQLKLLESVEVFRLACVCGNWKSFSNRRSSHSGYVGFYKCSNVSVANGTYRERRALRKKWNVKIVPICLADPIVECGCVLNIFTTIVRLNSLNRSVSLDLRGSHVTVHDLLQSPIVRPSQSLLCLYVSALKTTYDCIYSCLCNGFVLIEIANGCDIHLNIMWQYGHARNEGYAFQMFKSHSKYLNFYEDCDEVLKVSLQDGKLDESDLDGNPLRMFGGFGVSDNHKYDILTLAMSPSSNGLVNQLSIISQGCIYRYCKKC